MNLLGLGLGSLLVIAGFSVSHYRIWRSWGRAQVGRWEMD
jgi:hypothetical protein